MPQSLSRVYLHVVFSTKDRHPVFRSPESRAELHSYLTGVVKNLDVIPVEIGGYSDHVHLLVLQSRTVTIADLVKETKRVSTKWIQEKGGIYSNFKWQGGYGVFSVSQSKVNEVSAYIRNQEEHHREMSFQEEYRYFLKRHAITCDETYLWD